MWLVRCWCCCFMLWLWHCHSDALYNFNTYITRLFILLVLSLIVVQLTYLALLIMNSHYTICWLGPLSVSTSRGNIIRAALCLVVWHYVHSQQHTHMSSLYRSSRLGLSHWDPYAMHRGGCLELYYCNMVEWSWWDSGLICKTNWFPSVLRHCWFGHMTCKNRPRYDL